MSHFGWPPPPRTSDEFGPVDRRTAPRFPAVARPAESCRFPRPHQRDLGDAPQSLKLRRVLQEFTTSCSRLGLLHAGDVVEGVVLVGGAEAFGRTADKAPGRLSGPSGSADRRSMNHTNPREQLTRVMNIWEPGPAGGSALKHMAFTGAGSGLCLRKGPTVANFWGASCQAVWRLFGSSGVFPFPDHRLIVAETTNSTLPDGPASSC
jgi:hypothetical protein